MKLLQAIFYNWLIEKLVAEYRFRALNDGKLPHLTERIFFNAGAALIVSNIPLKNPKRK